MRSSSRRARSPTRENSTVFPGWCRTPNSTSFSATIARAGRNPEHVDVRARIAVSRPAPALRAAAWLGVLPSVLIGGFGSLLIAGIWMLLFPDLRRIDRFEPADKRPTES